jgi:signal transduction histidine kinase
LERRGQEAEEANRAKGEFLAAMSHELRTPLNASAGYAELIATGCSGPVTSLQKQQLERIQWSQQHLLGIINNILNFTRVEAGQLTYALSDVSANDIASECAALISPQGAAKGITIGVEFTESLRVVADRAKLQQILLNLLSNAIKFTPNDGRVTIVARDERTTIAIEVSDTGIGIPSDKCEAIFEPFVQLDRSLINLVDGTGLGLAISRELARAMGGNLTVKSELDVGSTFTLQLPKAST